MNLPGNPAMPSDETTGSAYDRVPYPSGVFAPTHPARLALVAALFGLQAPAIPQCRVLELGCGDGSNLIAMAAELPDARFVGIDLAARPIENGRERIARLGLANIRLDVGDVARIDRGIGAFDYVIANGLYSWVPPEARAHVLRVCAEVLAADGIAYISYNALPGCRLRHAVRELLHVHFGTTAFTPDQLPAIRGFLGAVAAVEVEGRDRGFFDALKAEIAFVTELPDNVLFHDDLAQHCEAFLLGDVLRAAEGHGLQYLGDADAFEMFTLTGHAEFDRAVDSWSRGDRIRREQHLDFVKGRRFRQTLLCHRDIPLDAEAIPGRLRSLHLRSALRAPAGSPLFDRSQVPFAGPSRGAHVDEPILKVALSVLAERYPDSIDFGTLAASAASTCRAEGVPIADEDAATMLVELAWSMLRANLIETYRDPVRIAVDPGPHPRLKAIVADDLGKPGKLVGPLNRLFVLDDTPARTIARAMDGTRDRAQLARLAGELTSTDAAAAASRLDQLIAFLCSNGAFESGTGA